MALVGIGVVMVGKQGVLSCGKTGNREGDGCLSLFDPYIVAILQMTGKDTVAQ